MFWRKKKLDQDTLDFLEKERQFYNEQLNNLKWIRNQFDVNQKLIRAIEETMEATLNTIRSYRVDPVFDWETGEILYLN